MHLLFEVFSLGFHGHSSLPPRLKQQVLRGNFKSGTRSLYLTSKPKFLAFSHGKRSVPRLKRFFFFALLVNQSENTLFYGNQCKKK